MSEETLIAIFYIALPFIFCAAVVLGGFAGAHIGDWLYDLTHKGE